MVRRCARIAAALLACRKAPEAPRVVPIVVGACVLVGLTSIAVVHGAFAASKSIGLTGCASRDLVMMFQSHSWDLFKVTGAPTWALFGVGLLAYLLYYVQKSDEIVILHVDVYGQVTRSKPQREQQTTWTSDPGH